MREGLCYVGEKREYRFYGILRAVGGLVLADAGPSSERPADY